MAATSAIALRALQRAPITVLPSLIRQKASHSLLRTHRLSCRPLPASSSTRFLQLRFQSTPPRQQPRGQPKGPKAKFGPRPSPWKLFLRAISLRGLFSSLTPSGIKTLYRQSPAEVVAAVIVVFGLVGISAYLVNVCINYFYARQFTKFPAPIAQSLRRALYYTNIGPDTQLAKKWYKKALEQCDELGLDPFSDDVLGIRIQVAAWLEKIGNYEGATTVLEGVKADLLKWVHVMEKGIADGTVDKSGRVPSPKREDGTEGGDDDDEVVPENLWRKRSRLLAKAVGTSTKLGELYGDDHVNDSENSQRCLSWAVETALSEAQRRSKEGVKPEEGKWLAPEEFGGAMESLGRYYEAKSQHHLAVPLFFQALRLCQSPCHRATIMNNLAASFAQHPVLSAPDSIPNAPATASALNAPGMPATREGFLEAAANWARNARQHAKDVESSERTPECDEACAVALSNMGDIAALQGKVAEARKRFNQCIELSRKNGFEQGVAQAESGLQNLNKPAASSA